jgi:hypothetical protein
MGITCDVSFTALVVTVSWLPKPFDAVVVVALTGTTFELTVTMAEAPEASVPLDGVPSANGDPIGRDALQVIETMPLFLIVTTSLPPEVPHATMLKSTCAGLTLTTDPFVPTPVNIVRVAGIGWQRVVVAATPSVAVPEYDMAAAGLKYASGLVVTPAGGAVTFWSNENTGLEIAVHVSTAGALPLFVTPTTMVLWPSTGVPGKLIIAGAPVRTAP